MRSLSSSQKVLKWSIFSRFHTISRVLQLAQPSTLPKPISGESNNASLWENARSLQPEMTPIQDIAFQSVNRSKAGEQTQDETSKRDHRNIGRDQKLFFVHLMSPGSVFMLPHGTRIVNRLLQFLKREYSRYGYEEVITPMLFNKDLWIQSGHWQNYKEDMFLIKNDEDSTSGNEEDGVKEPSFGLKPMNCPAHCLIYSNESRSYRELPFRLADFTALHR